MRIISGSAKGRKLKAPLGRSIIRPTSDKVRETVFNIIGPDIEDARFLDLFSGTGAVGIEALSRGARNVTFVDNRSSSVDLIKINLERCGFEQNFEILLCDVFQAISALSNRQRRFEFIFVDPPYNNVELMIKCLENISVSELIIPATYVLVEHSVKKPPPERISGLIKQNEYKTGDTMINLYQSIEA